MDKNHSKTLKMLLFLGVFLYIQYYYFNRGEYNFNAITGGLLMASFAYTLASLYGLALRLTMNYLLALVATAIAIVALSFGLIYLSETLPTFAGYIFCVSVIVAVLFCIYMNIKGMIGNQHSSSASTPAAEASSDKHNM